MEGMPVLDSGKNPTIAAFLEAKVTRPSVNEVTVEAEATQPSILVLTDVYFPGWRAEIDGKAAEIYRVNAVFRGVKVDAGRHTVRFIFDPMNLKIGFALFTVGLIAIVFLLRSGMPASSSSTKIRRAFRLNPAICRSKVHALPPPSLVRWFPSQASAARIKMVMQVSRRPFSFSIGLCSKRSEPFSMTGSDNPTTEERLQRACPRCPRWLEMTIRTLCCTKMKLGDYYYENAQYTKCKPLLCDRSGKNTQIYGSGHNRKQPWPHIN